MQAFNTLKLTHFAPTIAFLTGVPAPTDGEQEVYKPLVSLCEEKTGKSQVEKILVYNPTRSGNFSLKNTRKKFFLLWRNGRKCRCRF